MIPLVVLPAAVVTGVPSKICTREKVEAFALLLGFFIFYCFWQIKSIYGGDSGDLVTAAWVWGIPHPPGYPFYTLIASLLIHGLKISTPAWRVGLISSLSSAASLAIFYLLLKKMTNWVALLGTLMLAFLYPFWLYSELAEVFALNNLLALGLIYLFFSAIGRSSSGRTGTTTCISAGKRLILFFLLLGLSLAHHHTILLLFPGFLYLIFKNKGIWSRIKAGASRCVPTLVLIFLIGLSFYLYPLWTCRKTPLVCWDNPVNLKNLIHLVLRKDYGTFIANSNLGNTPLLRLYALFAFFKLSWEDFTLLGLVLIPVGLFRLYQKNKNFFAFILISLLTCLFFVFYASFMLLNDFMVATFERFLILPYILMVLCLALGVEFIYDQTEKLVKKINFSPFSKNIFLSGFKIIFFIIPLSLLVYNFKKITILKNDFTAENMCRNLLEPLPEGSILILSSDTTVFNTWYVHDVLQERKDVIILSYPHLPAPFYQKIMKKNFPQIEVSDKKDHEQNLEELIEKNHQRFAIFTDRLIAESPEHWLPYGLSWQYYLGEDRPATASTVAKNLKLWSGFTDPLSASLGQYRNLFLADVLRVYSRGRIDLGDFFLQNEFLSEAEEFFQQAARLDADNTQAYLGQGAAALKNKDCQKAKEMFLKALSLNESDAQTLGYLRKTSLECFENEEEAKMFEGQCLQIQEKKTSLDELLSR